MKILFAKKRDEKGASMLEYALLAALIAVVAIAGVTFIGQEASDTFQLVGGHIKFARENAPEAAQCPEGKTWNEVLHRCEE